MSTDKGYIKLYRDVRDHWIYNSKPFSAFQAWVDLIMMVNHEDRKVPFRQSPILVKRGSTVTSLRKLADRWGWNYKTVSRFLNTLEQDGMITQKRDRAYTTIKLVNYCVYQDSRNSKRNRSVTVHGTPTGAPDGDKQDIKEGTIEGIKEEDVPSGDSTDTRPWWEQEDDETDLQVQP